MHRNVRLTARRGLAAVASGGRSCIVIPTHTPACCRTVLPTPVVRLLSSTSVGNSSSSSNDSLHSTPSLEDAKTMILESALNHVHEVGWTNEAISQAVLANNLPLSMIGMVTPTDLIAYFMRRSQECFQDELDTKYIPMWKQEAFAAAAKAAAATDSDNAQAAAATAMMDVVSNRLETAIRLRLEYVLPYVKSNTWHEGMALGATSNATTTATQLDVMVQSIVNAILVGVPRRSPSAVAPLGMIAERAAIGALYVSTELHLLADDSETNEATWTFLKSRVGEMKFLATTATSGFSTPFSGKLWENTTDITESNAAIAATAVASSLGGAVVSLLQPAAREAVSAAASIIVPQLSTLLQPPQQQGTSFGGGGDGTRASDYNVQKQ